MIEEWRSVKDFPNYSVSSLGRVRREARGQGTSAGRHLKLHYSPGGYESVQLYGGDGARSSSRKLVHRLVCEAFHENPEGLPIVRHLDDVKTHNWSDNLAWGTHSENSLDASKNSRPTRAKTGECWRGHDLTDDSNFRIDSHGYKVCKPCGVINRSIRISEGLQNGDPRHGTRNAYKEWGCRCDKCTSANSEYNHRAYESAKKRGAR